ncbi:unnamed protein product [Gordionus sp. m RMFG-2023]
MTSAVMLIACSRGPIPILHFSPCKFHLEYPSESRIKSAQIEQYVFRDGGRANETEKQSITARSEHDKVHIHENEYG